MINIDFILEIIGITFTRHNVSEFIIPILIVPLLGLSLRITLSKCDQIWVATYHNTMSYLILPVITFVITKVISGNIPLALGMVGALSIVRFRHPVKNAFELVMYFALITIGIAASVRIQFAIGLIIIIITILILSKIFNILAKKRGKNIYPLSFAEGQSYNTLEITLSKKENDLSYSDNLVQEIHDENEKNHIYRFATIDKKSIIEKAKTLSIKHKSDIKNLTIDYI